MDHFQNIYAGKASEYHRMIDVEDADGNLLHTLKQITTWQHKTVIDMGSGTGRFPLLLQREQCRFICLDLFYAMLAESKHRRDEQEGDWSLLQGDMRSLPLAAECGDLAIAGWAMGHSCAWYGDGWQAQIGRMLKEMQRVTRPGGFNIICETMSTGSLVPRPPAEALAEYYHWLEEEHGFSAEVIQTDYRFDTIDQAVEYTGFFFGADLAAQIRANNWTRLPEWTGIWYRRV